MSDVPSSVPVGAIPSNGEDWIHLRCEKCFLELKIKAADDDQRAVLRGAPLEYDFDADCDLECPYCRLERNGHYPLLRVEREGGREALAALKIAAVNFAQARDFIIDVNAIADEDALLDAEAAASEHEDRAYAQLEEARERLLAMGYSRSELDELEWDAEGGVGV